MSWLRLVLTSSAVLVIPMLTDRVYRYWLLQNGSSLTERERWLADAFAAARSYHSRIRIERHSCGPQGPERSVGRGSMPLQNGGPN